MDPAAAATDTESALRSALEAAYRERESLTQRLDEVDQLIADLSQAAEGSGQAPTQRSSARSAGRKGTTKAATKAATKRETKTSAAKKGAKKSGKKSAKRAQRKATTKRAAQGATGTSSRRRSAGGGDGIGRTDRVVYLIAGANQPLSTGEVRSQLSNYEPDVTSKLVSASLSYAERKGRIRRTDDGRWVPVDAPGSGDAHSSGDTQGSGQSAGSG